MIHHLWKTVILVSAISLIAFLPPALSLLVERGAENLTRRAEATPLLFGAAGSPLELTLNSLYFNEASVGDNLPDNVRSALQSYGILSV